MKAQKHGTSIGWTHQPGYKGETWTVLAGCQLADYVGADGKRHGFQTCKGCYAMATAASLVRRFGESTAAFDKYKGLTKGPIGREVWNGNIYLDEDQLLWPLHCVKPRCFFLTSMGDLFYANVPPEMIARILAVMLMTPRHRYLVLTKRPDRMVELLRDPAFHDMVNREVRKLEQANDNDAPAKYLKTGSGHIFWGTSIEDQDTADWALHYVMTMPGLPNRWISYEPVFDYANLHRYLPMLTWGVIGGASKQRGIETPTDLRHMRRLVADFRDAGVPLYVKQLGSKIHDSTPIMGTAATDIRLTDHDNHNADPRYWPEDMRVQQFPRAA